MKLPLKQFSAFDICALAFWVWLAFFAVNALAGVLGEGPVGKVAVSVSGAIGWLVLLHAWTSQRESRSHPVNFVLVAVALVIALDIATVLTD
ncbi:MAG: hypothetical protein WA985_04470 [Erythrobacter sp.]|uniref:hypothetical protein n=1 Tax=Erythrobacter sp. TaxID=1042 RepID=UPI003C760AC0